MSEETTAPGVGPLSISLLTSDGSVLVRQRAAVAAFREAERLRVGRDRTSEFVFAAAGNDARNRAKQRIEAAAAERQRANEAAASAEASAIGRAKAVAAGEVSAAEGRAEAARTEGTTLLSRVGLEWVAEPVAPVLPPSQRAHDALLPAAVRAEAAVTPLRQAVSALGSWRETRSMLLMLAVVLAFIFIPVAWLAYARRPAESVAPAAPSVVLSPEEAQAAVADIRRAVRRIDAAAGARENASRIEAAAAITGDAATAYRDETGVRRLVVRLVNGWVTETYYGDGDVIFRYEHVRDPAEVTDGLRFYYRGGVPVRVRRDTREVAPGTQEYAGLNPDSVRLAAVEDRRRWTGEP